MVATCARVALLWGASIPASVPEIRPSPTAQHRHQHGAGHGPVRGKGGCAGSGEQLVGGGKVDGGLRPVALGVGDVLGVVYDLHRHISFHGEPDTVPGGLSGGEFHRQDHGAAVLGSLLGGLAGHGGGNIGDSSVALNIAHKNSCKPLFLACSYFPYISLG